jgi:hypothetical protein
MTTERAGNGLSIEERVIGTLLVDPALLTTISALESDYFAVVRLHHTFNAMRNLETRGEPINAITVIAELERYGYRDVLSDGLSHDAPERYLARLIEHAAPDSIASLIDALAKAKAERDAQRTGVDEAIRQEHEIDELALRDVNPADVRDPKLCPRLDVFFGDDEPDEDDSEDWNIRDILPREATLWGARQKGGKTWMALDLALALALGVDWLGFENVRRAPIRVATFLLEDGKKRQKRRLWELCRAHRITPNDSRVIEHLSITREPIRFPDDARQIAKRLKSWGPQVVIIDNLTRVMVGEARSTGSDRLRARSMRDSITNFARWRSIAIARM